MKTRSLFVPAALMVIVAAPCLRANVICTISTTGGDGVPPVEFQASFATYLTNTTYTFTLANLVLDPISEFAVANSFTDSSASFDGNLTLTVTTGSPNDLFAISDFGLQDSGANVEYLFEGASNPTDILLPTQSPGSGSSAADEYTILNGYSPVYQKNNFSNDTITLTITGPANQSPEPGTFWPVVLAAGSLLLIRRRQA